MANKRETSSIPLNKRLLETLKKTWHLGFTSFGGPSVHFQIFYKYYLQKWKWTDEQSYQEIFALCQTTPGPASTKMNYCINLVRNGLLAGLLALALWCLPGLLGMYGLALGIAQAGDTLPLPVYALITGLNAATVGIMALAAVQLSDKAITDRWTRIMVFLGGVAGILYSALWYFPTIFGVAGLATAIWDWDVTQNLFRKAKRAWSQRKSRSEESSSPAQAGQASEGADKPETDMELQDLTKTQSNGDIGRAIPRQSNQVVSDSIPTPITLPSPTSTPAPKPVQDSAIKVRFSWKTGVALLVSWLVILIVAVVLRNTLRNPPRAFALFANLYLAGSIILGGGPVVIPLLRVYISTEWVSERDFLLGLAIIQAFPGPNFNFAVYLGVLSLRGTGTNMIFGALIGFIGIFTPGITVITGLMPLWTAIRNNRWIKSTLRGINAAAVGLVYSSVYRLFQVGLVDSSSKTGRPLGSDPWWVAITAGSFVAGRFFGFDAFLAIVSGGVLGLLWYAVTQV